MKYFVVNKNSVKILGADTCLKHKLLIPQITIFTISADINNIYHSPESDMHVLVLSWPPMSATRLKMFSRKVIHKNRSFYNTYHSPISKGTSMHLFKRWSIKNFWEWNNWELSNVKPSQTPWVNSITFVNKDSKIGMFIDCRNLNNAIQRDTYSENDRRSDREHVGANYFTKLNFGRSSCVSQDQHCVHQTHHLGVTDLRECHSA